MRLTRSSWFPFPFFSTLLFVSVIPCALGAFPLIFGTTTPPFLCSNLLPLAPSLSSLGAIGIPGDLSRTSAQFCVNCTFLFPRCCHSSCFPSFSLSVHPSQYSCMIPLVCRLVAGWRGGLILLGVFWKCWCFLSVDCCEVCWLFSCCLRRLLFWRVSDLFFLLSGWD